MQKKSTCAIEIIDNFRYLRSKLKFRFFFSNHLSLSLFLSIAVIDASATEPFLTNSFHYFFDDWKPVNVANYNSSSDGEAKFLT